MKYDKLNDSGMQSLVGTLRSMDARRLGTLSFNFAAFGWLGLNVSFHGCQPYALPCSYLQPNILNALSAVVFLFGQFLALWAVRKGSLLPALFSLTFAWSLIATLIRERPF